MKLLIPAIIAILLTSCTSKTEVDLIVYNAKVYTVDSAFSTAEAIVVKDGKIVATGKTDNLLDTYEPKEKIDAKGKFIYPGLIDAHTHFYRYGLGLGSANLVGTDSWDEIITQLKTFAAEHKDGWLIGRGWDQNDWPVKEFPDNAQLNQLFPDRPVFLTRVDGHAAIANQKALDMAGIKAGDKLTGGMIEVKNGKLTGILVDNAVDRVSSQIPAPTTKEERNALLNAQKNCFAVGLTTVDECGLDAYMVDEINVMQQRGQLKMRVYAMLSDDPKNFDFATRIGRIKTDRLTVRAFKVYADGALGSRGACLLEPYSDRPGWKGFLLSNPAHFDSVAAVLYSKGFQMCTHAIGDSGNRTILNIYAKYLKGKNDLRWRIEHAQVVNKNDFALFGNNSVIPSVQPTHATSDMYWAEQRLGAERVKGAYAFNDLLKQNGWIPLGTDFPVEDISPFKTFYAAVVRKDAKGFPANGFQMENALSREDALRGMTIWAAKSNFEEHEKGSLETGKWADFIITNKDLLNAPPAELLQVQVLTTFSAGEKVYERK